MTWLSVAPGLFFDDLFDLGDFFLQGPGFSFVPALHFKGGIVQNLPDFFFDRTRYFVQCAFDVIFCGW